MKKPVLLATTNPGKAMETSRFLMAFGIDSITLKDLGITQDVEETGETLVENAVIKAKFYHDLAPDYLIVADDTGLEIDSLEGEPGIHVRRWKDKKTKMTDQEVIDYCLFRMKDVPEEKRGAQFRTVIALITPEGKASTFDGTLQGRILFEPQGELIPGFPFEKIFFVDEWKKLLGELHRMPMEQKKGMKTHREVAVGKAAKVIEKYYESKT